MVETNGEPSHPPRAIARKPWQQEWRPPRNLPFLLTCVVAPASWFYLKSDATHQREARIAKVATPGKKRYPLRIGFACFCLTMAAQVAYDEADSMEDASDFGQR
ncbi:hypothetical protein DIPPA_02919 [Diplonema papillatum]|nr:hypothetical protein DIPPA_02919 [Diplonema papillatum]